MANGEDAVADGAGSERGVASDGAVAGAEGSEGPAGAEGVEGVEDMANKFRKTLTTVEAARQEVSSGQEARMPRGTP
ncbi:hypothetical protein AB870_04285 [Pandoraea faecigallinarum]|uniref:Uncharacterized protein n=1 Tax=Pandoraea faecigallinarum TaxID=656179 RepID=A0A0H3WNH0_9BURK|nr:hypothetical protein AB870_04285 [Pandoraea faecigallinarum]